MKGTKFYKLVIVVLVVLNIGTLAFIWFGRPPHHPKPGEHPVSDVIGIEGASKKIVDSLEIDHHAKKKKLIHLDVDLHTQLYEAIGTEKDSDEILKKIELNKNEIEEMTYKFFADIAVHCDDSQLVELRKFVNHHLENLRPGPPPPPRK